MEQVIKQEKVFDIMGYIKEAKTTHERGHTIYDMDDSDLDLIWQTGVDYIIHVDGLDFLMEIENVSMRGIEEYIYWRDLYHFYKIIIKKKEFVLHGKIHTWDYTQDTCTYMGLHGCLLEAEKRIIKHVTDVNFILSIGKENILASTSNDLTKLQGVINGN